MAKRNNNCASTRDLKDRGVVGVVNRKETKEREIDKIEKKKIDGLITLMIEENRATRREK